MKDITTKFLTAGVYLTCAGVFTILALILRGIGANAPFAFDGPLTAVVVVIAIIAFFIAICSLLDLLTSGGAERGIYTEFIAEDPTRRDLPDAEFQLQFEKWCRAREKP